MRFELTNEHRKYLGLELVEEQWEKKQLSDECYIYFHGEIIRKIIILRKEYYYEGQLNEETIDHRTKLVPKTSRGKEKKLTAASIQTRSCYGNYFFYNEGRVTIANNTNQQTYYSSSMAGTNCEGIEKLGEWLDNWVTNSSEEYLVDINDFSKSKRKHYKFKEGDFFRFKIDRGLYGYGRIILNFHRLRIEKIHFWDILMGRPLLVKVYHIVSEKELIDLEELRQLPSTPSQFIMDNVFFYGEYEIIGNLPIHENELDFPIMYGQSISYTNRDKIMFQRGPVYKEISYSPKILIQGDFRFNSIGFSLDVNKEVLEACIKEKSNQPYWNHRIYRNQGDLRNPENEKIKELVLRQFGEI